MVAIVLCLVLSSTASLNAISVIKCECFLALVTAILQLSMFLNRSFGISFLHAPERVYTMFCMSLFAVLTLHRLFSASHEPSRLAHSFIINSFLLLVQPRLARLIILLRNDDTLTSLRFCRIGALHALHGRNLRDRNRSMGVFGRGHNVYVLVHLWLL
jgi:hypothetical protein